jgi:hypothetical protein
MNFVTGVLKQVIELCSHRYGGPEERDECSTLRKAIDLAVHLVDYNEAYPVSIRVDGVVRWERLPDKDLNFRWRRTVA